MTEQLQQCSNCAFRPPLANSRNGYCAECSAAAAKAWISRLEKTTQERAARDQRNDTLLQAALAAGLERGRQLEDPGNTCGYGVLITPGNISYLAHLKKVGVTTTRKKSGGVVIHPPADVPASQQYGWADGYAKELRKTYIMASPEAL